MGVSVVEGVLGEALVLVGLTLPPLTLRGTDRARGVTSHVLGVATVVRREEVGRVCRGEGVWVARRGGGCGCPGDRE